MGVHHIHFNLDYNGQIDCSFSTCGVHHIHFNLDYNSFLLHLHLTIGVHHIHFNLDYNATIYRCPRIRVYTISILIWITTFNI